MLHKQASTLHETEAELERVIEDHKTKQLAYQSEMSSNASKLSNLLSDTEQKDRKIRILSEERDNFQINMFRAKEQNKQLQAQLDQAEDDFRKAKRCSIDKDRLDAEQLRATNLEQSLQRLRRSTQQREDELHSRNNEMDRENLLLREDVEKHEKMCRALNRKLHVSKNEWKAREEESQSRHDIELQKMEQALASKNRELEAESECIRLCLFHSLSSTLSTLNSQITQTHHVRMM